MRRVSALLIVLGVCGALFLSPSERCPGAASRDELRSAVGGACYGCAGCPNRQQGCDGTSQCLFVGGSWEYTTSTLGKQAMCCPRGSESTGRTDCTEIDWQPCRWIQSCTLDGCNSCSDPIILVGYNSQCDLGGDACQGEGSEWGCGCPG